MAREEFDTAVLDTTAALTNLMQGHQCWSQRYAAFPFLPQIKRLYTLFQQINSKLQILLSSQQSLFVASAILLNTNASGLLKAREELFPPFFLLEEPVRSQNLLQENWRVS